VGRGVSADTGSLVGVSWMGTSCLCPEDAARELAVLRAIPMIRRQGIMPKPMMKVTTTPPSQGRAASTRRSRRRPLVLPAFVPATIARTPSP
ncbi:unnamed protein product, partial [Ectocarpus sp. 12 AP-2014]